MINRSLIRIKTVQILYSYLLTRTDFKLEPAPSAQTATRDNLFAYSVYLDFLFLLLKLSGTAPVGTPQHLDSVLQKNRVGASLRSDSTVTATIAKNREHLDTFNTCLAEIAEAITASQTYVDFKRKRKHEMADDVKFWITVFTDIVRKNKNIERILRRNEDFSHLGFEKGLKMFVDTLNSFDNTRSSYIKAHNDLSKSLTEAYNLYHALLYLPVIITNAMQQRLEEAKNKYLPTADDLNPNLRFVNNSFVTALRNCQALNDYIADNPDANPESWRDIEPALDRFLNDITATDTYKKYMSEEASDYAADAAFWRELLRSVILPSDELADMLENKSVYWNDDLPITGTFVLKTIRRSYAAADSEADDNASSGSVGSITLLPKFMNADDEAFGAQLFEYVVNNRNDYRSYIDRFIDSRSWDTERLAFMDIVIMLTAIAELINYPGIPVPVTMNEYIEIANDYSTARSGQFINGILFSVIKMLNEEGIIDKK